MRDLTILAVDPATRTGWACSDGASGAIDFGAPAKLPEVDRHALIGRRLGWWLNTELIRRRPGVLLVERQMTHGSAAHLLIGLRMVVLVTAAAFDVVIVEIWSSQWQPWAKATDWWHKDDELDARAMLSWWQAERQHRLEEA